LVVRNSIGLTKSPFAIFIRQRRPTVFSVSLHFMSCR
jgi:hypothetical protein